MQTMLQHLTQHTCHEGHVWNHGSVLHILLLLPHQNKHRDIKPQHAASESPCCLPELGIHDTVDRVGQLLEAKEGHVKVVDIATACGVGACHSVAASTKLQAGAAVSHTNIDGVVSGGGQVQ